VGSGKRRKKDTLQAQRVRLVQQLFYEACDILEAEGFDLYGESELIQSDQMVEFDER
jgi:hypothetical protein